MMTRNEAVDRATRIWGARDIAGIEKSHTPGWWCIDLRSDRRLHLLDGHGHTACHPQCALKEDRLP